MQSFQYRDSYHKVKTVSEASYLYNGNSNTWKDSLYTETDPNLLTVVILGMRITGSTTATRVTHMAWQRCNQTQATLNTTQGTVMQKSMQGSYTKQRVKTTLIYIYICDICHAILLQLVVNRFYSKSAQVGSKLSHIILKTQRYSINFDRLLQKRCTWFLLCFLHIIWVYFCTKPYVFFFPLAGEIYDTTSE